MDIKRIKKVQAQTAKRWTPGEHRPRIVPPKKGGKYNRSKSKNASKKEYGW